MISPVTCFCFTGTSQANTCSYIIRSVESFTSYLKPLDMFLGIGNAYGILELFIFRLQCLIDAFSEYH